MGMVTEDAPRNVGSMPIRDPNDAVDCIAVDPEMVLILFVSCVFGVCVIVCACILIQPI